MLLLKVIGTLRQDSPPKVYLTLQPVPMLWQWPAPLQVPQLQPHAIFASGAGRGGGC
jgi:hypothetical protein